MKRILETKRLLLREFTSEDSANLFLLNSNPEVMKYINLNFKITLEGSKKAVENWIKYYTLNPRLGIWPTILNENNTFIGWAALIKLDNTDDIEVAYRYLPQHWNKGYATEATKALLNYGFNHLNLDKLVAVVNPLNKASVRVIEKLGMEFKKTDVYYGSELNYYSISKDD